uniref:Serine protease, subtilisin family n=1 Tax=Candidatus Kentrum sp. LFY TaxID=2126342 RepID=A0A450WNU5_9GAMM|nr:MAG: Serine protease, subtilisin family [Candidatus Kentron sp. LFY]
MSIATMQRMISQTSFVLSVFLFCSLSASAAETKNMTIARDAKGNEYIQGEYVVRFAKDTPAVEAAQAFESQKANGVSIKKVIGRFNTLHFSLEPEAQLALGTNDIISEMKASPDVAIIEPNYIYRKDTTPNDSKYQEMWHMPKIEAEAAWKIQGESLDVVVAIVDTGVFLGHEDIKGAIWKNKGEIIGNNKDDDNNGYIDDVVGWDFYNNDNDPNADLVPVLKFGLFEDPVKKIFESHGTHVAGTVGAVGNNGTGVIGVTPKVQIMPLKFLGGSRGSGSLADAISAIDYAVAQGAQVINNSWGGSSKSANLKAVIQDATDAGVIFVAAAGNSSKDNDQNPHYPSSYDVKNVVAVAATDSSDKLANFSCYGKQSVDLAAPGVGILSTVPLGDEFSQEASSGYKALSGTSMATPLVSGCIALARALEPEIESSTLVGKLLQTGVDKITNLNGKVVTGGRLNCRAYLQNIELAKEGGAISQSTENDWLVTIQPTATRMEKKALLRELRNPEKISPIRDIYKFQGSPELIESLRAREGIQAVERNTKFYIDR